MDEFEFRQCEWDECRFRFPTAVDEPKTSRCPMCGAATNIVAVPAPVHPLLREAQDRLAAPNPTYSALLDNIRSIHNVGSMFRSADGAGISHIYLCGISATPAHPNLSKAALGAQASIPWTYALNGVDQAQSLKEQGHLLWAIETAPEAEPFFAADLSQPGANVTLVIGNERAGVDPGILALCDKTLALPMAGSKRSLNAAVAMGIVCYYLRFAQNSS
ncbi:MAG: TrmH family RNA methyltransferase [Candidatus Promineifilaceae bacterium]